MEKNFISVLESVKLREILLNPPRNLGSPEISPNLKYALHSSVDWDKVHPALSPEFCLPASRSMRKKKQLEAMVLGFKMLYDRSSFKRLEVVDFCCGAGHVGLLLAALFPCIHVYLIEWNKTACKRAYIRRMLAGLTNVSILPISILDFPEHQTFDIGVGLHACGWLTDEALRLCFKRRASFVMCPCCIGKLGLAPQYTRKELPLPRSLLLRESVSEDIYIQLSKVGDHSNIQLITGDKQGILTGSLGSILSSEELVDSSAFKAWIHESKDSEILFEDNLVPSELCEEEDEEEEDAIMEEGFLFGKGVQDLEWTGREVLSADIMATVFGMSVLQKGVAGANSAEWGLEGLSEHQRAKMILRRARREEKKKRNIILKAQNKQKQIVEEIEAKAERGGWSGIQKDRLIVGRRACKRLVDFDRLLWATEKGDYDVIGFRMHASATPKGDMLVGWCAK